MPTSLPNSLQGEKIAVLVANGFNERDLTSAQKILQECGAYLRVISMDNGLVNSWNGTSWGLNFAADSPLNEALAADFSMLLVPGGRRSVDKLKLTAHTRRFINGFLNAGKPLAMLGDAVELLIHIEMVDGRTVSAPEEIQREIMLADGKYSSEPYSVDGNLMTGAPVCEESHDAFIQAMVAHFMSAVDVDQAA